MRRYEREITKRDEIDAIIAEATICRLSMCDDNIPYIVPMCFGYDGKSLYFHSAAQGRKIELLRKNNRICFEFDLCGEVVEGEKACGWSIHYRSVIGTGQVTFLDDVSEKRVALNHIMRQYDGPTGPYDDSILARVCIFRIDIDQINGKKA